MAKGSFEVIINPFEMDKSHKELITWKLAK